MMADPTPITQVASQIDTSTPSGIMAALGIAIAGIGLGGLQLKRMWRNDGTESKNTAREQAYLDGVSKRVQDLEAKLEKLTEEKLEAEKKAIRLEVQVDTLTNKIKHIEEEKEAIRKLLHDVEEKYNRFREENFQLKNSLHELQTQMILVESKAKAATIAADQHHRPEMDIPLEPLVDGCNHDF